MDDVYGRIEVFPQHFLPPKESMETADGLSTIHVDVLGPQNGLWELRHFCIYCLFLALGGLPATRMMTRLLSYKHRNFICSSAFYPKILCSNTNIFCCYQIELTRAEVESLRSEIADADERESQLKARLENIDEVLRYARLSGYLHIRSRWTQLPGEPPIIDDADVDDWLPRFVVLQGQCIYYYLKSTDLSPQESTLLCDIVEVGQLPNFVPEDGKTRYAFYVLTRQGLKFECSSIYEIQVDSWVRALRGDCKLAAAAAEVKSKASGSW